MILLFAFDILFAVRLSNTCRLAEKISTNQMKGKS